MFTGDIQKRKFVEAILLDPALAQNFINPQVDQIYHLIWYNPINPKSYRLTQFAYSILVKKYTAHSFELENHVSNGLLLRLEKHFKFPYYIHGRRRISLFNEPEAIMIKLMGDDILSYLTSLESR